jgi:hypothetical protein
VLGMTFLVACLLPLHNFFISPKIFGRKASKFGRENPLASVDPLPKRFFRFSFPAL